MKKSNILNNIAYILSLYFGAAGVMGALISGFEASYRTVYLYIGLLLFVAYYSIFFLRENRGRYFLLYLATPVIYVGILIWNWEEIQLEVVEIYRAIVERLNTHYNMHLLTGAREGVPGDITVVLLLLGFAIVAILSYSVMVCYSKFITGFIMALAVIVCLSLGRVPPTLCVIGMILCYCAVVVAGGRRNSSWNARNRGVASGIIATVILMIISYLFIMPPLERYYSDINSTRQSLVSFINEKIWPSVASINNLVWENENEQVLDGRLDQPEGFSYTGARVLEVSLDKEPRNTLYLKGYIGSEYDGKSWRRKGTQELENYARSNGWNTDQSYAKAIGNLTYIAARETVSQEPSNIEIIRVQAADKYLLHPYGDDLGNNESVVDDGSIAGEGLDAYSMRFYPVENFYPEYADNQPLDQTTYYTLESQYRQYVQENYLSYPDNLTRLKDQMDQVEASDREAIIEYVVSYLADNAVYNLDVPPAPEGKDFTEYFLYENKQGYCVHFATAAVLMLRMKGIPARYVTGYVAPQSIFSYTEDGSYEAEVQDNRAHAWAEVYLDGWGWVPIEATPGYSRGVAPVTEEQQVTSSPTTTPSEQTATPTPMSEDQGEQEENSSEREPSNLGYGVLTLIIIIIAIFLRRLIVIKWRYYRFGASDNRENIRRVAREVYKAMIVAGLSRDYRPESVDFAKRAEIFCPKLRGEFGPFWDMVLKANYSDFEFTWGDTMEAQRMYYVVCRTLIGKLNPLELVLFRLFYAFV